MRVQKQNGSEETEYVYFGGQPIAERDATNGDWSDYIFAGGRRLARADSYAHRMRVYGTRCSNCGFQWYQFNIPNAGGLAGYTIRTGDRLIWLQWQNTNARGGLNMTFTDGSETYVVTLDQNGYDMNNSPLINQWDYRRVDLSQHAGKTVSQLRYSLSGDTLPGYWESYYDDVVLVSTDGKVQSVYNGQKAVSLGPFGSSGMTGTGYEVNRHPTHGQWPGTTTFFYHGDHLGSSRLQTGSYGYPLWEATYLPYGQEWVPPGGTFQPTANHYKFTGKERDGESGLDYFGARYYASALGRFLSPDPIFFQSSMITDPQRFNLYTYARNNPLLFIDPTGETIQLTGTEEERKKQLQAIRDAVGEEAGEYLYENRVEVGKDKDGNPIYEYHVGIRDPGPGQQPFHNLNENAAAIGAIIESRKVASIRILPSGTVLPGGLLAPLTDMLVLIPQSPGHSLCSADRCTVSLLDFSKNPGKLPASKMSNNEPGDLNSAIILAHELGHVGWLLGVLMPTPARRNNTEAALELENKARRIRDPGMPFRRVH